MRIKLLIATADYGYAEHLSKTLAEKYTEVFEVTVCTAIGRFRDLLADNTFDAALLAPNFAMAGAPDFVADSASDFVADNAPDYDTTGALDSIRLPLLLVDDANNSSAGGLGMIQKYQRISSMTSNVLERCAEMNNGIGGFGGSGAKKARVCAAWSPSGGAGKTTVALAYAAKLASKGKAALYLNLENFSSTSLYFADNGKSISKAFEKLESNVHLILKAMRQQDSATGIYYFNGPENYDDINILTTEDIDILIGACAADVDELIIDLPSICDARVQQILTAADAVFVVCDPSITSREKMKQFINQHNIYAQIQTKIVLVNNKGAVSADAHAPGGHRIVQLPRVQSADPISVYKMLSSANFDADE